MEPTQSSNAVCIQCHNPFIEGSNDYLGIFPCRDRVHAACLKAFDNCPGCNKKIDAIVKREIIEVILKTSESENGKIIRNIFLTRILNGPTSTDKDCFGCHEPLENSPNGYLGILACGHRVHTTCLKVFDTCPSCNEKIEAVVEKKIIDSIIQEDSDSRIGNQIQSVFKSLSIDTRYSQLTQAYFLILDKLTRNAKSMTKTTFYAKAGCAPVPKLSKSEEGFSQDGRYWYVFLLDKTLEKLNLQTSKFSTDIDPENMYNSDVAVLVLNFKSKDYMTSEDACTTLWDKQDKNAFISRFQDNDKIPDTYVINITKNPKPDLLSQWPGVKHYHVTDLKSLYKAHLRMAARILNCDSKVLNSALSSFDNKWKSIMRS